MSETTRVINASPEAVFDVLRDGWTYASWVVGAARIRAVDPSFPAEGSKIHHSVGAWPVMLSDETVVEKVDVPHLLQLKVKAWPTGEGRVTITCEPQGGETLVRIVETAISGPAKLIPAPVESMLLRLRNVEALKRLAYLAEGGARSAAAGGGAI